ncbi:MAG: hypothetical protein ABEJ03_05770 [Candidatus Nanohaloarchaea archaeon]
MKFSIHPTEQELREARESTETAIKSWEHSVDVENLMIDISWRKYEHAMDFTIWGERASIILDPEKEWKDKMQENILLALLGIEYVQKSGFENLEFNWQEVAQTGYIRAREQDIREVEVAEQKLDSEWDEVKSDLENETYESIYREMPTISSALAANFSAEEILEMKRSDVIEALREEFE